MCALTFVQNLQFQNIPDSRLDDFQFDGGLVTDAHETKLQPNQAQDLANTIFNQTSSIKTRNGYIRYNGNPVSISSDQSNTGTLAGTLSISDTVSWVAQTIIPSGAISVTQVDSFLAMNTSGQTQYVRVELWSTSGSAPSAMIGQSQYILITGTSETQYSFRFREPVSLSASTTYALVIKPLVGTQSDGTSFVNTILISYKAASYANGQVYTTANSGLVWSGDATKDLKFVVYSGGNTAGTGLVRFYTETGVRQLLAKIGTSLYRGNDSTGALTATTLGSGASLTSANIIDWTVLNDTLLITDDDHNIQKYRGSTNANYSTGTITATNGDATVTGSGTSWATPTNCEVGEYIQLPDGKWYKVIAVTDDTHLEIEINYQGSTLGAQSYKISPWGEVKGQLNTATASTNLVVPNPKFIATHANRVWALDGNSLYFSTLDTSVDEECFNDFDTSNNAGQINISFSKGDVGTGLYSLNGYLYIFSRNSIWELLGTSPNNFDLRNVSNEIGMIDKRTLVEYNSQLIFLSDKGIYIFDGANLTNISENVVNNLIDSWANKSSASATLWKNNYIIAYTAEGDSYNSEALFYDMKRGVFGKIEGLFANVWSRWEGGSDTGQIYFISSNQGSIYKWDIGTNDDGYEIETRYKTPSISWGQNFGFGTAKVSGTDNKTIKKVYLQQVAEGHWSMDCTMYQDLSSSGTISQVDLDSGSNSLWDVSEWDVDSWSSEGTLITSRIAEFQGTVKYASFEFKQIGLNQGMEILGVTTSVRVRRLA